MSLTTNSRNSLHLSNDQIDDALLGDMAPEADRHLAACELCAARLAEARMPIDSFRTVTLAWSERRSATLPLQEFKMSAGPLRSAAVKRQPIWASAVAVLLALAVAVPVLRHETRLNGDESSQVPVAVSTPVADQSASDDQISRDNQMLSAIDRDLAASTESPAALGLKPVRSHISNQPANPSIQD